MSTEATETTQSRVIRVISEMMGIAENAITPASHMEKDLGADSLDKLETCLAIEDEFAIEIPDEDAEKLTTVQEIIDYVTARQNVA